MFKRIGKSYGYFIQIGNILITPARTNHKDFLKRQKKLETHLIKLKEIRNGK